MSFTRFRIVPLDKVDSCEENFFYSGGDYTENKR